jgi:hypothetical protein
MKNKLIIIFLVMIFAVIIEALSFILFNAIQYKFTFASDDRFIPTKTKLETVKKIFHPTYGWKTIYKTKFGERPRELDYPEDLIASFGDSFTHCDEVKDNETWQTFLSRMVEKNVYNFGNGAYSTDQAYLRFTHDYPLVKTKIAVLGLITENINRVANVYRPFYFPGTGVPATKPHFVLKGDELVFVDNPISSADEVDKLLDVSFLKKIGQDDYWYTHQSLPRLAFPYTGILFNRNFWGEVRLRLQHKTYNDLVPRSADADLWENVTYERIMQRIFDKFVHDSKEFNTIPVIMIFPMWEDADYTFKNKRPTANVKKIASYCSNRGYLVFDGVDALVRNAADDKDLKAFYSGHLSQQGNQVIAKEFYAFLKKNKLLQD